MAATIGLRVSVSGWGWGAGRKLGVFQEVPTRQHGLLGGGTGCGPGERVAESTHLAPLPAREDSASDLGSPGNLEQKPVSGDPQRRPGQSEREIPWHPFPRRTRYEAGSFPGTT